MGRRREDLADWLWPDDLQELQDTLTFSLELPVLFVDSFGHPLAACEDLSEFCRHFTRGIALPRPCLDCGRAEELKQLVDASMGAIRFRPFLHLCPLGIMDVALPVFAAGPTIAYIISAQVCQADEEGTDTPTTSSKGLREAEDHVALLSRLRHKSESAMESAAATLAGVAWLMGALAGARRRNLRLSERIREQSRWIQAHTLTDAVTGLANRRRFYSLLEAEIARAERYKRSLSVAALDIQQFRKMNEEFGHDVGDAALRAVARCLTCTIRKTDVAGRIGGDEFALLFPETQRHEAMMALARLSACVEDLNASGELPVEVRLSLGIVDQIMSPQDMLTAALEAATQQFDTSPRAGSRELDARSETDLSDVGSAPR